MMMLRTVRACTAGNSGALPVRACALLPHGCAACHVCVPGLAPEAVKRLGTLEGAFSVLLLQPMKQLLSDQANGGDDGQNSRYVPLQCCCFPGMQRACLRACEDWRVGRCVLKSVARRGNGAGVTDTKPQNHKTPPACAVCRARSQGVNAPREVLLIIDGVDEAEAASGLPHGNR